MQRLRLNSPECLSFLEQFGPEHVSFARAILSNVRFVSASEYTRWLQGRLSQLGEQDDSPIAFLIVRQLNKRKADDPFEFAGSKPGSEGRDAHIVKAITKPNQKWFVAPSLEKMRREKVRRIVLVCDSVGSGQELTNYANAVFTHPTIKSWVSSDLIQSINVAACVVMDAGVKAWHEYLKSVRHSRKVLDAPNLLDIDAVAHYNPKPITVHPSFHQVALRNLLTNYAKSRLSQRRSEIFGLGFGRSEGSVVFEPNLPNNLPALLWMDSDRWQPLFRGRLMDRPELFEEMDSGEREPQQHTERKPQQHTERRYWASSAQRALLNALINTRSYTQICRRLGWSQLEVSSEIKILQAKGWVTNTSQLTEEGQKVLRLHAKIFPTPRVETRSPTEIYIPSVRSRGTTGD